MTEKKLAMYQNFRRHAFSLSPPGSRYGRAAVKQKAKEGLDRFGRGIACLSGRQVLRFSKTQPVRFWFLCAVGLRRLP
jgi:hypothetical protein